MQRANTTCTMPSEAASESRELRELLDRLPPDDASALRAHIRLIAAEAMRQGITMAASLLMANFEHGVNFNVLARQLPVPPILGAD